MHNAFYKILENILVDDAVDLHESIAQLAFNEQGLIPVITQCVNSGEVLMQAWMNDEAIKKSLHTRQMTYWSRGRNSFWIKGETSGHIQELVSMHFDCDGDAILCKVEQAGAACHTGRPSCFYLQVDTDNHALRLTSARHTTLDVIEPTP